MGLKETSLATSGSLTRSGILSPWLIAECWWNLAPSKKVFPHQPHLKVLRKKMIYTFCVIRLTLCVCAGGSSFEKGLVLQKYRNLRQG